MTAARSLQTATTLRVGGVPRVWESVSSLEDLEEMIRYTDDTGLVCRVLGEGSNVLARDGSLDCAVIEIHNKSISVADGEDGVVNVTAGAGIRWDDLVGLTVDNGWWGIENLSAIPGTVGAAPVQNIGAYGVEFDTVCVSARVYDCVRKEVRTLEANEMGFQYRDSHFKKNPLRYVIWDVTVRLSRKPQWQLLYKDLAAYFGEHDKPEIRDIRSGVIEIRRGKFPDMTRIGTAGSFFKNPHISQSTYEQVSAMFPSLPQYKTHDAAVVKVPIAYVLERMGYKGYRNAAVGMHDAHALVLVAYDGATSRDVDQFALNIEKSVQEKTGIILEREVQFFP